MTLYFFPKYNRLGASSRYRTFQYLPAFESVGLRFAVYPLFDDAYLELKYAHDRVRVIDVLRAITHRLWAVLTVPRFAVVVVEYELLPWFPAVLERWLTWRGCRVVVDYDDALFHKYDAHPSPWVRNLLGYKIFNVMRLAHIVVVGNSYLADYARLATASRVEVIPTVIDLARYPVRYKPNDALGEPKTLTIGWIGSPSTARYLLEIAPALAEVCREQRARVCLVGSGPMKLPGVQAEMVEWREETEVDEIFRFDIGIMPLPDEPWTQGKCGLKLIQYMACGLPVVASPVGVNVEIVEDGTNGLVANTTAEWVQALNALLADAAMRKRLGQQGRLKVARKYCLQVTSSRMTNLLLETAGHKVT